MFQKKVVKTKNINQAAMLMTIGGTLVNVCDTYPTNTFVVTAPAYLLWYERHLGFVPYRRYCHNRVRLKEKGRVLANLPKRFTGRQEGFTFEDLAHVRPFSKTELTRASE